MGREDAFAKAKQRRQEQKAEEESRGGFEQIAYGPLISDAYRVFRFLGNPASVREKPSDAKIIEQSMLKGDDGKKFRVTWPLRDEFGDWFLWKLYDFLTQGEWEKDASGKNKKIHKFLNRAPEIMARVLYNDNQDNQYEQGWRPGKAVLINVIDRHDPDYHTENAHTKLISKKMSEYNGSTFFERGIPVTLYEKHIWDNIVEYEGDWEKYDIVIKKLSKDPYYGASYGGSDDLRKRLTVDSPETIDLISMKPLSAEEAAYVRYNIDEIAPVTSYTKLHSKLKTFVKKVDAEFATTFSSELEDLVAEEKRKRAETKEAETEKELKEEAQAPASTPVEETAPVVEKVVEPEVQEAPVHAERPSRSVREPKVEVPTIDWDGLADGTFNGTVYKGVPKLTAEEKSMVLSVNDDGSFDYVKEWEGAPVELFDEKISKFDSPGQFHCDPLSGAEFE